MTSEQRRKQKTRGERQQHPKSQKMSHAARGTISRRGKFFTGKRAWALRIALALGTPMVFLLVLELLLIVWGIGTPASFFVKADRTHAVTPNQMFVWFYRPTRSTSPHPHRVAHPKPAQTLRLFVLGGSAAMGTPQPAYSFSRILELMVQDAFPEHRVEVVNTAMRGVNSHILVPIAEECTRFEPDLMILYAGNNEFTGRYGADTLWGQHPGLIPLLHAAKSPRTSQLVRRTVEAVLGSQTEEEQAQGMPFFREQRMTADHPNRGVVYRNYRANLTRICNYVTAQGAEVLIVTLPVNLRNWAPVGALHRPDLQAVDLARWESLYQRGITLEDRGEFQQAMASYLQAARIDDHYADLHYRLARCYLSSNQDETAYRHFSLARDWDALQFRADSKLNDTLRSLAEEMDSERIHLVDAAQQWARPEFCGHGISGKELFNDHVHFNFRGDYEMAKTLLPVVMAALKEKRGIEPPDSISVPSQDECARRLAYTSLDHLNILTSVTRMAASPPFTDRLDLVLYQADAQKEIDLLTANLNPQTVEGALQMYQRAIAARPQDWNLRFGYANHLYQLKNYRDTATQMQEVVREHPDIASFRILLGYSLAGSGSMNQAMEQFRHARQLGTHNEAAQKALDHYEKRSR